MYVVATGNLIDGIQLHGTFPTYEEAKDWAKYQNGYWWIIPVRFPE